LSYYDKVLRKSSQTLKKYPKVSCRTTPQ